MAEKKRRILSAKVKYEILREISFRIRDTFNLDEILNHLLDTVEKVISYDAAGIFVLNQDVVLTPYYSPSRVISGIVQRGFDLQSPEKDQMLTLGKGIVGYVVSSGESLIIPDVRLDSRYVVGRRKTLSEIAVPIFRAKSPIGALNLESDTLGAFNEDDLEVLRFLADTASISIEKALQHVQILEKKKIEAQLQIAREVQERLLPEEPPRLTGYDIAGICLSTYDIGGDYFDFLPLDSNSLGIAIADVSGNGIPAALLMMGFKSLLLTNAAEKKDPEKVMEEMNRFIPELTRKRDFITAIYGILNSKHHIFRFTNAGHYHPLVLRARGDIELVGTIGPGLNIIRESSYETSEVIINPDDILLLYTDGVLDIFNSEREDFGIERLKDELRKFSGLNAKHLIERIISATKDFSKQSFYTDDLTIIVVKRLF
jgi:sigma-B regulation protein RsbU (phosphoserine phosphatase)